MYECITYRASSVDRMAKAEAAAVFTMLSYGGKAVEAGSTFAFAWLAAATPVDGKDARILKGLDGLCHHNCLEAVLAKPSFIHMYGYALSEDGCWYEHSWLMDPEGCLIETTEPRLAYLGTRVDQLPKGAFDFLAGIEWLSAENSAALDAAEAIQCALLPSVDLALLSAMITPGEPALRR